MGTSAEGDTSDTSLQVVIMVIITAYEEYKQKQPPFVGNSDSDAWSDECCGWQCTRLALGENVTNASQAVTRDA